MKGLWVLLKIFHYMMPGKPLGLGISLINKFRNRHICSLAVVTYTFNFSTWEAETGGFLSSRPAWSIEWVPGQPQPGIHRETLSWKNQKKKKKKKKERKKEQTYASLKVWCIEFKGRTGSLEIYRWDVKRKENGGRIRAPRAEGSVKS